MAVDDRIHPARHTLRLPFLVHLQLRQIQGIEAHLDLLARQVGRSFEETVLEEEGGIAAHQTMHAMEKQAPQIGGGRKLADALDIECGSHLPNRRLGLRMRAKSWVPPSEHVVPFAMENLETVNPGRYSS